MLQEKLKELTNVWTALAALMSALPGLMHVFNVGLFADSPQAALYSSIPALFGAFAVLFTLSKVWDQYERRPKLWASLLVFLFGTASLLGGVFIRSAGCAGGLALVSLNREKEQGRDPTG